MAALSPLVPSVDENDLLFSFEDRHSTSNSRCKPVTKQIRRRIQKDTGPIAHARRIIPGRRYSEKALIGFPWPARHCLDEIAIIIQDSVESTMKRELCHIFRKHPRDIRRKFARGVKLDDGRITFGKTLDTTQIQLDPVLRCDFSP